MNDDPSLFPPLRHNLFAAFAGGGAKGLVHVGALKALENRGFDFQGVAGTSAGAIVAALKAAGYKADEIISPELGTTVLDTYARLSGRRLRPIDLFGPGGWRKVQLLKACCGEDGRAVVLLMVSLILCISLVLLLNRNFTGLLLTLGTLFLFGIIAGATVAFFFERGGLTSLRVFRDAINKLVGAKLFGEQSNRVPRMGDFGIEGRPSLRIVAADITTRQLRLFSSDVDSDKDLAVADVVAASVCIPLLFRPWEIAGRLHVDGGIVSNLPAWPFDEERALDVDAVTVAFEILERGPHARPNLRRWLIDVALTAAFGSDILSKRAVDRLTVLQLETDLSTLDFSISRAAVLETVREATLTAEALISTHLVDRPSIFKEGCRQTRDLVYKALGDMPNALGKGSERGRVRVALAFREEGFLKSLRLNYSAGFDQDADEGIILPRAGSFIGEAWNSGEAILNTRPFPVLAHPGARRLNKLFAKDIQWILAVPIYGGTGNDLEPRFVVAVDGSDVLNEDDVALQETVDLLSSVVEEIFVPIANELAKSEASVP
ncbi:MAG: patatin-like phospholipase family protein [Xanthobacteraceae bacterium]|nr:patatin-like phospholipase family protein [Xanthobacteraceae bacterium]